jgi:hypothetical protein
MQVGNLVRFRSDVLAVRHFKGTIGLIVRYDESDHVVYKYHVLINDKIMAAAEHELEPLF